MSKNKTGIVRLIKDDESHTGTSAAILLRNINPIRYKNGKTVVADREFKANFSLNCDGYRVRPKVSVSIVCELSEAQSEAANKKRLIDRAMAGSPMLK